MYIIRKTGLHYLCVYTNIYLCMCVYTHMCPFLSLSLSLYIYIYVCVCVCVCVCVFGVRVCLIDTFKQQIKCNIDQSEI